MGFRLSVSPDKVARIEFVPDGDSVTTFIESVKGALGQRAASVVVDVSNSPNDLAKIADPFEKLIAVTKPRGIKISLVGSQDSPLVQKLKGLGVELASPAPAAAAAPPAPQAAPPPKPQPPAPPSAAPTPAPSGRKEIDFKKLLEEAQSDKDYPVYPEVQPHFEYAYAQLSSLLKEKEALEKEITLFTDRAAFLKKSIPGDSGSKKEFEKLREEEAAIAKLRESIMGLRKELADAQVKMQEEEKLNKDFMQRLDQEKNKELATLQKDLSNIVQATDKANKEFEARSTKRREEIKKRQQGGAPGGAPQ